MSGPPTTPRPGEPSAGSTGSTGSAGLTEWVRYFNDLEKAMHDFEVGLSQQNVAPLRSVPIPPGHPPEQLRTRSGELYLRISELEFRARIIREELRAASARLPRGRTPSGPEADWNFGSALDING
jgi:hypothetical protein